MRIGITGHQRLDDPSAWEWVEAAMAGELDRIHPPVTGVTSLAAGADQLFADLVLQRRGALIAVVPFAEYERTFDEADLERYRALLARSTAEILRTPGTDEDAYLAAGMRVVALSDLVIAVWNGQPAKGKGGTGDVVAYARGRRVPVVHLNPVDRTVSRIE